MRTLVLASTSPARRAQLERLGVPFVACDPGLDEAPYKTRGLAPRALVAELAEAKARAVVARHPDALILGGDQVAELDGAIFGKPGTIERAEAQLATLAGRTHALWTAIALVDARTGQAQVTVEETRLTMRALSEGEIQRYVARVRPLGCAGAYAFEGSGAALFERVAGDDPTAIPGLPLMALTRMLLAAGVEVV